MRPRCLAMNCRLPWALLLLAVGGSARAGVEITSRLGDHGVLQRGQPVPIRGRTTPGGRVVVSYRGQAAEARGGHDGRWEARLGAMLASDEGSDLVIVADEFVIFRDVVVADVWLCAGQSNLEFPVSRTLESERPWVPGPARFWQWNRAVPNCTNNAAMRDGEWKLVRPPITRNALAGNSDLPPVLFNLQLDPLETTIVAAQHPERYARMSASLEAWSQAVDRDRVRTPPQTATPTTHP